MPVNLYPHQQLGVDQLAPGKVLWGGVGSGKTRTALAFFVTKVCGGVLDDPSSMRTPMDLLILTTAKKRDSLDWEKEASEFYLGNDQEASAGGIMVTVDSWNNIDDYLDFEGFVIFDEQRAVGKGKWSKSFIKIGLKNPWIMLSATPGDNWLDYIPLFLANGWYKNRTDFIQQHVVWKPYMKFPVVERFTDVHKLVRQKNYLLVHMPYARHTRRHIHDFTTDPTLEMQYNKSLYDRVVKDRWHVYEERPLKDVAEMFAAMRKVVNSDESRMIATAELMEKHTKLIVFYNFNYELEMLRALGRSCVRSSSNDHCGPMRSSTPQKSNVRTRMESTEKASSSKTDTTPDHRSSGMDRTQSRRLASSVVPVPDVELAVTGTTSSLFKITPRPSANKSSVTEALTSENVPPSDHGTHPSSTNSAPSTNSNSSTPIPCWGHWTEDEGDGEEIEYCPARTDVVFAEWNGHKHQEIPTSERWVYLVQYVAGAEGWNCVETDAMIFWSLTYSYKNYEQGQGRIDRMNTPFTDLNYYVLRSKSPIDAAIFRALGQKRNFNEREVAQSFAA